MPLQYSNAEDRKILNHSIIDRLKDSTQVEQVKSAEADLTSICRIYVRENPWSRKILAQAPYDASKMVPTEFREDRVMFFERETPTPAAVELSYMDPDPDGVEIGLERTRMVFNRIASQRYYKDVALLESYDTDVRQLVADNSVPAIGDTEDAGALAAQQRCVGDAVGDTSDFTGYVHWQARSAMTRGSLHEQFNVLPSTGHHIPTKRALISVLTLPYIAALDAIEWGSDQAGQIMTEGFTGTKLAGVDLITTIKHEQIPLGTFWHYGPDGMVGRMCEKEEATLYVERKMWFVEFCLVEQIGSVIENPAAIARVDFTL